jgi:hypothetical protein
MIINSFLIEQIKDICISEDVPHWKVIPELRGFYANVPEHRTYPREIKSTARDIIAKIKGETLRNDAQLASERRHDIHNSHLNRDV